MKKIFFLSCILFSGISFAQTNNLDSLLRELRIHTEDDTARLSILNQIAYEYCSTNPGQAIFTADKAILLAQKLNDPVMLARAYKNKGAAYDSKEEDSSALYFYNKALQIYESTNRKLEIAKLLHNTGIIYQRSDVLKALKLHQRALQIFLELNEEENTAVEYRTIGVDYNYLSNYPAALESLQKSLKIFESSGNKQGMGTVYANMGITYTYLNDFQKAMEYHKNAIKLYEEINYEKGLAEELGNIGNVYDDMDDSTMALRSYMKALALSRQINNKKLEGSNLANIGIVYNYYDNYSKAFPYLSGALNIYEHLKFKEGISLCLSELAIIYSNAQDKFLRSLGTNPKDRYTKVLQFQKRALELARETGSVMRQAYRWDNLADTYKKQNDFRNAFYAFQKAVTFRDSALNNKKSEEITRLEMRYDFNKKEDSVKAANEKKQAIAAALIKQEKTKKDFILTGAIILIIASIAVFIFYKRRRDAEEKKHEAEFKAHANDTELKALRAQMNPHFIFNSLNSISNYISKNNLHAADEYLTKFASLMRSVLENSDLKEVSLEEDLKVLELYMQLESVRLNHKFTYEITVADDIDKENTMIPPLILQPFVENSIWHGIAQKEGKGKIIITIKKEKNMINCTVDDNGVGLKPNGNQLQRKSMGMKITKSRIEIINKIQKTNASVRVLNLDDGARAEVRLPLQLNF